MSLAEQQQELKNKSINKRNLKFNGNLPRRRRSSSLTFNRISSCNCGTCSKCYHRFKTRKYRERKNALKAFERDYELNPSAYGPQSWWNNFADRFYIVYNFGEIISENYTSPYYPNS